MVGAGLELLDREGLNLSYQSVSYRKVFAHIESKYGVRVTRGSVHERIWNTQGDFRRDVLAESVRYLPEGNLGQALLAVSPRVGGVDLLALAIGNHAYPSILKSMMFGQFQSLKVLASRLDDHQSTATLQGLLGAWAEVDQAENQRLLLELLARSKLRPRPELGLNVDQANSLLHTVVAALTGGGYLNHHAGSPDMAAPVRFKSASSPFVTSWPAIAIGVKCIVDFLYVADPEAMSVPASEPTVVSKPILEVHVEPAHDGLRRPRKDLKRLVLDAAVELLLSDGLQLKPESLGYGAVFAHLKATSGLTVNRSSVHRRFWLSNEEYAFEVLTKAILRPVPATRFRPSTIPPLSANEVPEGRRQAGLDRVRQVANTFDNVGRRSIEYRRLVQVKAALVDQGPSARVAEVREAVRHSDRERGERNKIDFQQSVLSLGYRAKAETGLTEPESLDLFVGLSMAAVRGIALNEMAGIRTGNHIFRLPRSDPKHDGDEWTAAGLFMHSCLDQLYDVPT